MLQGRRAASLRFVLPVPNDDFVAGLDRSPPSLDIRTGVYVPLELQGSATI